jgi:hypothetical protein
MIQYMEKQVNTVNQNFELQKLLAAIYIQSTYVINNYWFRSPYIYIMVRNKKANKTKIIFFYRFIMFYDPFMFCWYRQVFTVRKIVHIQYVQYVQSVHIKLTIHKVEVLVLL